MPSVLIIGAGFAGIGDGRRAAPRRVHRRHGRREGGRPRRRLAGEHLPRRGLRHPLAVLLVLLRPQPVLAAALLPAHGHPGVPDAGRGRVRRPPALRRRGDGRVVGRWARGGWRPGPARCSRRTCWCPRSGSCPGRPCRTCPARPPSPATASTPRAGTTTWTWRASASRSSGPGRVRSSSCREIQPAAGRLTVFQRSAPYVVPKPDVRYAAWRKRLRLAQRAERAFFWALCELGTLGITGNAAITKAGRVDRVAAPAKPGPGRGPAGQADAGLPDRLQAGAVLRRLPAGAARGRTCTWRPRRSRRSSRPASARLPVSYEADVLIYGTGFTATDFLAPIKIRGACRRPRRRVGGRRAGVSRYGGARVSQHVPDVRPEHEPRLGLDHLHAGAAGPLHPPGGVAHRRARVGPGRPRGGGGPVRRGDAPPARRHGVDARAAAGTAPATAR